jgi:hypothetical protein
VHIHTHTPLLPAPVACRLTEIQSVAGQAGPGQEALDALVGGDFDPDEYDRQMAAAFGDDYYAAVRSACLPACMPACQLASSVVQKSCQR